MSNQRDNDKIDAVISNECPLCFFFQVKWTCLLLELAQVVHLLVWLGS